MSAMRFFTNQPTDGIDRTDGAKLHANSKGIAKHQSQRRNTLGPQTSLYFGKCPSTESHTAEDVQSCSVIKITETYVTFTDTLMNEVEARTRTDICRPTSLSEGDWQAVCPFQVDSTHIRELTKGVLYTRPKIEVATKYWTDRRVYAEQEQLRIQSGADSYANLPTSGQSLNFVLYLTYFLRRGCYIGQWLRRRSGGGLQDLNSSSKAHSWLIRFV